MTKSKRIAIIGASIAGIAAADAARTSGYTGEIHVYDAQEGFPYDKPPMSKGILTGDLEFKALELKPSHHWDEANVKLRLGQPVLKIDEEKGVLTADGWERYDGIILATGGQPRSTPFPIHPNVRSHILRTTDDAQALRDALVKSEDVVIIGGGFIGMEVAAAARKMGRNCTVVERERMPLGTAVGDEVAGFILDRHKHASCEFRTNVSVSGIDEARDGKALVHLSNGDSIHASTVVLSIGVEPAVRFLEGSGLEIDNGIVTDGYCQTNLPKIYACGDVARTYSYLYETHLRIEHWTTAREQGARAASNLIADLSGAAQQPFMHVPYVWSDQFDMKIQIVGRHFEGAVVNIVHLDDRSLVAEFHLDGTLCGGVAINKVKNAMEMRRTMHKNLTSVATSS